MEAFKAVFQNWGTEKRKGKDYHISNKKHSMFKQAH